MSAWPTASMESLAAGTNGIVDGPFGSDLKTSEYVESGVPLIRIQNVRPNRFLSKEIRFISEHKAKSLVRHSYRPGDIVITKLGDPCGVACIVPEEAGNGIVVADIVRFRGDSGKINHRFLSHFINSPTAIGLIAQEAKGTTRQRVNLSNFKNLPVPVPPLEEQQRIAEILDRAEALRAKGRAALAQLDILTQSIFLDLFGDPTKHGWPLTTISEIVDPSDGSIRTGPFGSQLLHSEFVDKGVAVLGIDNAVANEFRWDELRFISHDKYRKLKRYTVRPGDVLITIMGTCGRCAIVPDNIPLAINTKHLCCVTLDQKKCLPVFLHAYFLRHPLARRYLEQTAKGAIMSGLNMGIIKPMPIPIPPMELQREFSQRVVAVEKLKTVQLASLSKLDALFAVLQHRAFRGEL